MTYTVENQAKLSKKILRLRNLTAQLQFGPQLEAAWNWGIYTKWMEGEIQFLLQIESLAIILRGLQ